MAGPVSGRVGICELGNPPWRATSRRCEHCEHVEVRGRIGRAAVFSERFWLPNPAEWPEGERPPARSLRCAGSLGSRPLSYGLIEKKGSRYRCVEAVG